MHAQRSWIFEQYLRRQPQARRLELIAAEKEFSRKHRLHLSAIEEVYWESMRGYADSNEGTAAALVPTGVSPEDLVGGDWSWKPYRDKALGVDMVTFRGVPPSAAELYGRNSYRPA